MSDLKFGDSKIDDVVRSLLVSLEVHVLLTDLVHLCRGRNENQVSKTF